ncbi:MAG TPA: YhcH/YjgK/YiaL family protein [Mucilaginibacter sp.]|jgi:YhcH/YjgK/YiaL family protein|nr:YhcH/YjgK/YiaL family protein [Mucilaginibacter sp.]
MKILFICKNLLLLIMLSGIVETSLAQNTSQSQWNETTAAKWVRKGEWKNGLKLKVHATVNKVSFAGQYHKNKAEWDKALSFLRDSDLAALKPGRYDIDGDNVYALITEAPSKTFEQSAWESHRKYIDLQYVITGKEKIGIVDLSQATVTKPYDEAKDFANYSAGGKFYTATPDAFFLFFPNDVHRPNILIGGYPVVKKLVIKIRVAE